MNRLIRTLMLAAVAANTASFQALLAYFEAMTRAHTKELAVT